MKVLRVCMSTFQDLMNDHHFIQIPPVLAENLSHMKLTERENKVVWAIIRKTFGFKKLVDWIAHCQFEEMTNISAKKVSDVVAGLENKNVIGRIKDGWRSLYYIQPNLCGFSDDEFKQLAGNELDKKTKPDANDNTKQDKPDSNTPEQDFSPNHDSNFPSSGGYNKYSTKDKDIIKEPCSENEQSLNSDQSKPEKQKPEQPEITFQEVNAFVFEYIEKKYGKEFTQANDTLIQSKLIDNEAYCRQNNYTPKPSMALQYVQTGIDNHLRSQYRTAKITASLDEKANAVAAHQQAIANDIQRKSSNLQRQSRTAIEAATDRSWGEGLNFNDVI